MKMKPRHLYIPWGFLMLFATIALGVGLIVLTGDWKATAGVTAWAIFHRIAGDAHYAQEEEREKRGHS